MSDLRNRIEDLSTTEKIELLDLLWESLDKDDLPLTEDQRRELDDNGIIIDVQEQRIVVIACFHFKRDPRLWQVR